MPGVTAGRSSPIMLASLLFTLIGCPAADSSTTDPAVPKAPIVQVVNSSGGRIDHVTVLNVTFTQNLSYNTSLYGADNGSYCGDGCSTGFVDITEGTHPIAVAATATSAAVQVGSLGAFQNDKSYSVNIRKPGGSYCAELWQKLDTSLLFNADASRVLISTSC